MKLYDLYQEMKKTKQHLKELENQLYYKNRDCEATKYVLKNPYVFILDDKEHYSSTIMIKAKVEVIDGRRYIVIPLPACNYMWTASAFQYALDVYNELKDNSNIKYVGICHDDPTSNKNICVEVRMLEDA